MSAHLHVYVLTCLINHLMQHQKCQNQTPHRPPQIELRLQCTSEQQQINLCNLMI